MRVLIIDDDPALNRLAAFALQHSGMSVVTTTAAREGVRLAAGGTFDAVLLDVVMPELDGPGVLRELRDAEGTRQLPVVFMSAIHDAADVAALRAMDVRGVIRKPFDPAKLHDELLATLGRQDLRRPGAEIPAEMRRSFLISAVDQVNAVARSLERLQRRPSATECLREVAGELHRLAGTAGSYGLGSVADAARRGEEACAAAGGETQRGLREALQQIRADLAAAGAAVALPAARRVVRLLCLRADPDIEIALRLLEADSTFAIELAADVSSSHPPDVLVVPADEEGLAAVERLRAEPRGRRMTVVMTSNGRVRREDLRDALAADADEWITDPADHVRVIGALRAVVERRFGRTPRVLCIALEHAESFASVIESAGYAVCTAENAAGAELDLETFEPDLVVAGAANEASLQSVRLLRLRTPATSVPVVLVASRSHPDPPRLLATTGASALLQLPISRGLMLATIASQIDSVRARRFALQRDPLTGCLSETYFRERVHARLSSTVTDSPLTLAMIETTASDRVLIATADLLRHRLRETDEIARCGEARLAILMEGVEAQAARALLGRILDEHQSATGSMYQSATLDRDTHASAAQWLSAAEEALRAQHRTTARHKPSATHAGIA